MKAESPQAHLLATNLQLGERVAARLKRSTERIAALFPLGVERLSRLDEEQLERLDAFLKRFEQLSDLLQTRLFRTVLALEGEDIASLSRRDTALLLERIGMLASAEEWQDVVLLRNVLTHEYPEDDARQAERLNLAFSWSSRLLNALYALRDHVREKRLLP